MNFNSRARLCSANLLALNSLKKQSQTLAGSTFMKVNQPRSIYRTSTMKFSNKPNGNEEKDENKGSYKERVSKSAEQQAQQP